MTRTMKTKRDYYFDFLCDTVWERVPDIMEDEDESCEDFLLRRLHEIDFYSLVPNDDNRGEDGIVLRDTYLDHNRGGFNPEMNDKPCSVLEMLIGLSYRLEFETAQSRWEKTPKTWFWILIENLGLDFRSCRHISRAAYAEKIDEVVHNLLERHYKGNGEGGLFPLKHPKKDQRRVEIWYQMSAYIIENYPI